MIKYIRTLAVFAMMVSLVMMLSWALNFKWTLNLIGAAHSMTFSTSLCFFISGLALYFSAGRKAVGQKLSYILALLLLGLSGLALIEYFFYPQSQINNLVHGEYIAKILSSPMSPTTSICFFLFGLSLLLSFSKKMFFKRITQHFLWIIAFIAVVSCIAYVLQIPTANKSFFFKTMAVHTSLLFVLLSIALAYKNKKVGLISLFLGNLAGTRLIRWFFPFAVSVPLILSFVLLHLLNNSQWAADLGIILYTLALILVNIVFILIMAIWLNQTNFEQIKLEKSLRRSNQEMEHLKYALDQSSIVAMSDGNGVITYANDKFCEISKYSREELIGKPYSILNSGYHSREFFMDLWHTISNGKVWVGGFKNKAKDGSFYWVHSVIVPFRNESGRIYQYLTIRQDISRLTQISTQYENLKLKSKEIEQFTFVASHDLQEPLHTVMGMVNLMQLKYKDVLEPEAHKYLNFVMEASQRMSNLIKGLLDYSRIGGKRELKMVDLAEIIEVLKKDLAVKICERKVEITTDALPTLLAYETELYLLLQNLLSNAIKFQPPDNIPKIHISAKEISEFCEIAVRDNGIGIENIDNRNIFALFKRLHGQSDYEGTGIGLAHCEKIVHLHGGQIWVESELNKGSTFHFSISKHLS